MYRDGALSLETLASESRYPYMIRDAQRYLPLIGRARYVESLFEIKTILTQNEVDDGRPILFRENYGFRNFSIVMGSKIDNIYDALDALRQMRSNSKLAIG